MSGVSVCELFPTTEHHEATGSDYSPPHMRHGLLEDTWPQTSNKNFVCFPEKECWQAVSLSLRPSEQYSTWSCKNRQLCVTFLAKFSCLSGIFWSTFCTQVSFFQSKTKSAVLNAYFCSVFHTKRWHVFLAIEGTCDVQVMLLYTTPRRSTGISWLHCQHQRRTHWLRTSETQAPEERQRVWYWMQQEK